MSYKIVLPLLLFSALLRAQVERVEPPFWWEDMNHDKVQLMLYGDAIAQKSVSSEDLPVLNVLKTENQNYLFVTVDTGDLSAGSYELVLTASDGTTETVDYELRSRREASGLRQGFDSSDLIYLLMPDRFANGNPENDSHPALKEKADRSFDGGRHGGDIEGIIQNLDYIENLGATAIWSTPLCEDDDERYSYHTYAQSDVYRIDPRYGTNEDYKRLASELHKREMKLIMDYVTNHWGLEHWMIQDLPAYDWIHQFPGYGQTNYRMTTQMDPNASAIDTRYNEDGWFVRSMPDLNQENPLVLNYLIQNAIWWIEYADLDGFRVDTYSYGNKKAMAEWTNAVMKEYPNFNIVGEVWMHDQAQIAYWQKDSELGAIQSFNSHLPSVMDFTLHNGVMEAFREENPGWNKGMITIYENFVNDFLYPDIDNIMVFAENHDTPRINELYRDFRDYRLIMTLIATVRGIPQIYYGSEIGMQGDKQKGDGDIRRDFPGGWSGDKVSAFKAEGRTKQQKQYYDFSSQLFNWRKNAEVIHRGETTHFVPANETYVYFRHDDTNLVMVVLNNSEEVQTIDLRRFSEMLKDEISGYDILQGKQVKLEKTLEVSGKTPMIIEIK
ncbi:glycoside hydrolase family 13 protein [Robertkochia aurantiaca]|uniref:glycoside hydrolase family 13 protein n=1 Tax=Robertkochia aurantiaca TaxID=2873700 RepID=UPI001CCA162A|nr:glycoside hydrolase family 13 protein [Robertkochia sp. 3YJGBD-33]